MARQGTGSHISVSLASTTEKEANTVQGKKIKIVIIF